MDRKHEIQDALYRAIEAILKNNNNLNGDNSLRKELENLKLDAMQRLMRR